jgi:peroxiredoxin
MALTYTPAGELGMTCPDFHLPSVTGENFKLKDFDHAKALVVMFICGHCPYVKAIEDRLVHLAREFEVQGAAFAGICANDPAENHEDRPEELLQRWREKKFAFPYLIDDSQEVARAFGAVCTPDLYVFDAQKKLRYRGRLDDSWRKPENVTRRELAEALTAVLKGEAVQSLQNPSMGCSIKWKMGD